MRREKGNAARVVHAAQRPIEDKVGQPHLRLLSRTATAMMVRNNGLGFADKPGARGEVGSRKVGALKVHLGARRVGLPPI